MTAPHVLDSGIWIFVPSSVFFLEDPWSPGLWVNSIEFTVFSSYKQIINYSNHWESFSAPVLSTEFVAFLALSPSLICLVFLQLYSHEIQSEASGDWDVALGWWVNEFLLISSTWLLLNLLLPIEAVRSSQACTVLWKLAFSHDYVE